jgi:[FeFe] hydrogenase H-cluster maturation GTPase HydF
MGKESIPHIGIFGRMNNGKSSIINRLAGQEIAIVADYPGTTTDPVKKSVEVRGVGPVVFVDTAGMDDKSDLGASRVKKTAAQIKNMDLAILVIAENNFGESEEKMVQQFQKWDLPFFIVHNKADIQELGKDTVAKIPQDIKIIDFSALNEDKGSEISALIRELMPETAYQKPSLLGGLLQYGDIVLLITPIDIEAPEGRLILPQVLAIRDILDNDCVAIILKEREVDVFLRNTNIKPKLAVTDSQVFLKADAAIPKDVALTSFSIMLARFKGAFEHYLQGTPEISNLKNGDRVLMLESCTHQVSCDDIGRVKIPRWISSFTGKSLEFEVVSGLDDLPRPISEYALVVQCGGCMITRKQIYNRLKPAIEAGIPVTNYGMAIAYVQGIYSRATAPFTGSTEEDYL